MQQFEGSGDDGDEEECDHDYEFLYSTDDGSVYECTKCGDRITITHTE